MANRNLSATEYLFKEARHAVHDIRQKLFEEAWFAQIYGKIDELHAAIFAQSGLLFFKMHNYTVEELLSHPLLESIQALCGQVDNVVQSWQSSGNVDAETVKLYYDNRILIEQRL